MKIKLAQDVEHGPGSSLCADWERGGRQIQPFGVLAWRETGSGLLDQQDDRVRDSASAGRTGRQGTATLIQLLLS
jgi:hypothetical protein